VKIVDGEKIMEPVNTVDFESGKDRDNFLVDISLKELLKRFEDTKGIVAVRSNELEVLNVHDS
jgi:hypothetical protein